MWLERDKTQDNNTVAKWVYIVIAIASAYIIAVGIFAVSILVALCAVIIPLCFTKDGRELLAFVVNPQLSICIAIVEANQVGRDA